LDDISRELHEIFFVEDYRKPTKILLVPNFNFYCGMPMAPSVLVEVKLLCFKKAAETCNCLAPCLSSCQACLAWSITTKVVTPASDFCNSHELFPARRVSFYQYQSVNYTELQAEKDIPPNFIEEPLFYHSSGC